MTDREIIEWRKAKYGNGEYTVNIPAEIARSHGLDEEGSQNIKWVDGPDMERPLPLFPDDPRRNGGGGDE